MKRSIANAIKSGDQDTEIGQPVAEVIAESGVRRVTRPSVTLQNSPRSAI